MIMVCVTGQTTCAEMISYASKIAKQNNEELTVVHICREDGDVMGNTNEGEALQYLYDHTRAVGAEMLFLRSNKISQSIVKYAQKENTSTIILGKLHSSGQESYIYKKLKERLPDVIIVGYEKEDEQLLSAYAY